MRIRPDALQAQLKKGLAPNYLVAGDEPLQHNEATDLIRQHDDAARLGVNRRRVQLQWEVLESLDGRDADQVRTATFCFRFDECRVHAQILLVADRYRGSGQEHMY